MGCPPHLPASRGNRFAEFPECLGIKSLEKLWIGHNARDRTACTTLQVEGFGMTMFVAFLGHTFNDLQIMN